MYDSCTFFSDGHWGLWSAWAMDPTANVTFCRAARLSLGGVSRSRECGLAQDGGAQICTPGVTRDFFQQENVCDGTCVRTWNFFSSKFNQSGFLFAPGK